MMVPDADREPIAPSELPPLADWRHLVGKLRARFVTRTFGRGLTLVGLIAEIAEAEDHHPDVDLRYGHVDVAVSSHDVGAITQRDIRLAREISTVASELGAGAEPASSQMVSLALDTHDADQIRPFWVAALRLQPDPDFENYLLDPEGRAPGLFLQPVDERPTPTPRFHVDLNLSPEMVEQRIADCVAAGGRLVSDDHAPAWWTLADPQGNQIDIATWQGRG